MIDYSEFFSSLKDTDLAYLEAALGEHIKAGLCTRRYGDLDSWLHAYGELPRIKAQHIDLQNGATVGARSEISERDFATMEAAMRRLIPWRKGPFDVFGLQIDTEWRSDWKWQRVLPHLDPLRGRTVLDVGCGNGYHCLRMFGAGATRVIGIDPSPRFVVQFYMLKHFLPANMAVDVLPVGIEALPPKLHGFDTTFSMGVLYHRRSPMDHLRELKETLRPGGQLVLETLVIDGELGEVLVPEGRYAMMNNVWFIPTSITLCSWLRKCGFEDVRVVNETVTSEQEQRATDWMRFHSLKDFLDPQNSSLTAEGHPAPRRAVITARANG